MDEHRDIYQKPGSENKAGNLLPAYELTPDQVRTRTRQQVVIFSVVMVGLLASAAIYFYFQEPHSKNSELEDALKTPIPERGTTKPAEEPPPAPPPPEQPPPDLSPQKMAEAMTALREGNKYLLAHQYDQAELGARQALEIWPNMNAALRMLGVIYTQRGQVDQAIAVLERAIKIDPFNGEAHNTLGTAYLQKRMFTKAEESYLTALQLRPNFVMARVNLGMLYLILGRHDQALDNFEEARKFLPDDVNLLNNMGVSYVRLQRFDDARAVFLHAIEVAPETAVAYFNVAITYTLQGDFTTAMDWIRKGAAHCPPTSAQQFLNDPDFDKLRSLPAFQEFARSLMPDWISAPKS